MLLLSHKPALLTLSAAAFIVMLANSILTLAIPSLGKDLSASAGQLNWIVEAYPLFFAGLLLTFGSIADRFGRKRILLTGLLLFTTASIITAFTEFSEIVIMLRAVSGIGGAMIMPSTLSIINSLYIKEARIKAIAIWSAVSGIGTLAGSLVGGVIITYGSWREAFLFQVILGAIVFSVAVFTLKESKSKINKPLDFWGYALSFIGIILVVLSIMNFSSQEIWLSLVELIVGLSILVAWFFIEKHSIFPSLNVHLFRNRAFCVGSVTLALAFFAVNSLLFLLSQLFQSAYNLNALSAAILTIVIVIPLIVVSPASATLIKRYGERITLLVGILLMFIGFALSTFWDNKTAIWIVASCLVVLLSGMVLIMNPATNMLLDSVSENDSGMASAMNDLTRELGGALGIAILGSLVSALFAHKVQSPESFSSLLASSSSKLHDAIISAWVESFTAVMWVGAGLTFGILCFVFFFLKENKQNVR